jgi:CRISPR-associated protein Cmr2
LKARLDDLRNQAFENIATQSFNREAAIAQIDDLIEYAWVSAPESGLDGYAQARSKAEALLTARKNTRLWGKVTWGAEVPKSSVDGERESVLHEDLFDKLSGLTPDQLRKRYGVGPAERICGVGLLKRHGIREGSKYAHRFLSTGHLAAWPLYQRIEKFPPDEDQIAAWKEYLSALERAGVKLEDQEIVQGKGWDHFLLEKYDGSLLFENRLSEVLEEFVPAAQLPEALRNARAALARFLGKLGVSTPLPYYAILVADGDNMGKAIKHQTTFNGHRNLSRALDRFAQGVRTTVESDHGGELIYAGGDDVLALVPLHQAVKCARKLAVEFQKNLSGFPVGESNETPTLSAGIGISHFLDPLRSALNLARKAESLAKVKRNSLAVIVDKRSGAAVEVTGPWGSLDERLETYVAMHRNDWVPDGAAYELQELERLLDKADEIERTSLVKLVRKEAERILRRKQPEHGAKKELAEGVLNRLIDDVQGLALREVADSLIVARLLAQAWEEADPTPPGGSRP